MTPREVFALARRHLADEGFVHDRTGACWHTDTGSCCTAERWVRHPYAIGIAIDVDGVDIALGCDGQLVRRERNLDLAGVIGVVPGVDS